MQVTSYVSLILALMAPIAAQQPRPAHAAEPRLEWLFSEQNEPENKGRMTARLLYWIPETDAIQVSGVCEARSSAAVEFSTMTFGAQTGNLPNGQAVDLRFSGGGFDYAVRGTVQRSDGEGLTGVVVSLKHDDPLWTALSEREGLDYLIPGYKASSLELEGGREKVKAFLAACRTYAGILGGPSPTLGSDGNSGSAEAAFNAAKELGTVEAWDAFLANYPTGFHADLARAYKKKLLEPAVSSAATAAADAPSVVEKPVAARPSASSAKTQEISCKKQRTLKSRSSDVPARVTFVNNSGMYRSLWWIDFSGNFKDYGGLNPGERMTVETFVSHPWVVATGPGDCLQIFLPGAGESSVGLRRLSVDGPVAKPANQTPPKQPLKCGKNYVLRNGNCVLLQNCGKNAYRSPEGDCYCNNGFIMTGNGRCVRAANTPPPQPQQNPAQELQNIIQGIQDLQQQNKKKKCPPGTQWNGNICLKGVDTCPGDSALNAQGKCVKTN